MMLQSWLMKLLIYKKTRKAFTPLKMNPNNNLDQPIKELVLPAPHYLARMVRANETYILAGRGTFKTSRGIALYMVDMIYEMPKSTGVCVGLSFEHLGDNTLPPLLQALDEFGFEHGVHYVIGKRPPSEWPKPFLKVKDGKYDHCISWHNGTVIYLVSLMKKASANGVSAQWGFFDEVKFMDEKELNDEIFPIFRGNKKQFQHSSGYLSKLFATDKKADPVKIKWLLNKRKLQDQKKIRACIALQMRLTSLEGEYSTANKAKQKELLPMIDVEKKRLVKLRSNMVYVTELSAYDVLYAHGEKWLKDKQRNSTEHEFNVIYKNMDPDKPGDSFYPSFKQELHTYEHQYDIDPGKPLILTGDYQHSVSPFNVAQLSKIPGKESISLNYVDEVYTLATPAEEPKPNGNGKQGGLNDAVQLFCDRYRGHIRKTVYYVFDHTAIGKRGVGYDTHKDAVSKVLKDNGWHVVEVYTGMAPDHYIKYTDTDDWLSGKDATVMPININRRCEKLIISITGAPAKTRNGKTEKDKDSEKESTLDQSETTHYSDTFDMANHAVLKLKLIKHTIETKAVGIR
jgi:hypothetical protein